MIVGLVVKSHGHQLVVEVDGQQYLATAKGKKTEYVVGDKVELNIVNSNQAQIIGAFPRSSVIFRSDNHKSKILASNITQLVIVIAAKPSFNSYFLNSCLICAESQNITPLIVINKSDLPETEKLINYVEPLYQNQLRYNTISLSAAKECSKLLPLLSGYNNLLIGQSGVGKSTITNKIVPTAQARVGGLDKSERRGTHTTTNATFYHLDQNTSLIDCPGLQEFGLSHLEVVGLAELFPECRDLIGKCRFRNCHHMTEPSCAIILAAQSGTIDKTRLDFLQYLTERLLNKAQTFGNN